MKIQYYPDFTRYYLQLRWVAIITLLATFCLTLVRFAGLFVLNIEWQDQQPNDFISLFFGGLRYDIATMLRAFFLFILASAASLALPLFMQRWANGVTYVIGLVILFLAVLLDVGNLAYLVFFGTPFDEFIIEALMFDWHVIIAGMFGAGASVFYIAFGLLASAALVYGAIKLGHSKWITIKRTPQVHWALHIALVVISLVLIAGFARGTLSTFPLSAHNAAITASIDLNKLALNGPFTFYNAAENYATSTEILPATDQEGRAAFKAYYGTEPTTEPIFEQFFAQTPLQPALEQNPPHVFLGIVESLSSSLLDPTYTGSTELSQRLNKHFDEDGWFPRFTPAHNFTQGSIANILTSLDYPVISQSTHKRFSLDTAAAKVFQQKGYRTIYIYSGYESVRDGASYYLRQGFDEFIGANALLKDYPNMPLNVWGGEDWYAFDYAKKVLASSKEPVFILMHTLTNHPPYAAPKLPWQTKALSINKQMRKVNGGLPEEALRTYHYTTEVVGEFLDHVKQGELANNTIVGLTGDHGQRGALSTSATDLFTKAVPFYLYLPQDLKPKTQLDYQTLASHRDIMPTIYNLALSEAKYPDLGNNLYSNRNRTKDQEFAILHHAILTNEGYVLPNQSERVRSFESANSLLYGPTAPLTNVEGYEKALAYRDAIDWLKRYQLHREVAQ